MTRRSHLRIARIRFSWPTVAWLAALWVLLWGELSVGNVVSGAVVGLVVTALLPLPAIGFHGKVRPLEVLRLLGRFVVDLTLASFQVAFLALNRSHVPHGAVIGVHLRSESDLYLALTAVLSTLVPGSVVVEALRRNGMLYLHVLDVELMGGVEKVRKDVLAVEERVLRALASDQDLYDAGLSLRSRSRTR